jgi:hypothetical protein
VRPVSGSVRVPGGGSDHCWMIEPPEKDVGQFGLQRADVLPQMVYRIVQRYPSLV